MNDLKELAVTHAEKLTLTYQGRQFADIHIPDRLPRYDYEDEFSDMDEEEFRKEIRTNYEVVSPEKYHQYVTEENPEYAVVTGRMTRLGYLVSVFDLELGRIVYAKFGWGAHLSDGHLKDLKEAIREGKV